MVSLVALVQAVLLIRGANDGGKSAGRSGSAAFGVVPFVVVFESSSGSSWLLQLLGSHPAICAIGFEPIDNISMSSASDHALRIRWLDRLWTPRIEGGEEWASWMSELQAASVFGQLPIIQQSLQRCDWRRSRAFGLKARLSRLLTAPRAIERLAQLVRRRGVRIIRLSRRNRIKQALAEYNRLHAGLGQFVRSGVAAGTHRPGNATASSHAMGVQVDLERFGVALRAVERSRRLTSHVLSELGLEKGLSLEYELLLSETDAALGKVADLLRLSPEPMLVQQRQQQAGSGGALRKATSDRLCLAVANYRQLCQAYVRTDYAQFFDPPPIGQGACSCHAGEGSPEGAQSNARTAAATADTLSAGSVATPRRRASGANTGPARKSRHAHRSPTLNV